ncbi:MAG TPA: hypothetical protein VMP67_08055 [Candidatus Limnocylindria bacterium]|nr:hypothetical protein [Candidatus Limnocylindria bacterium]
MTLDWLVGGLYLLLAIFVVLHAASALRVYLGASERRPRNVSDELRQPSAKLAQLLGALALVGFRRLGETEVSLPDTSLFGPVLRRERRHTIWLLVDGPGTTMAAAVEPGPLVSFETWLADGSVLQTTHPFGETLDAAGLTARVVRSSPQAAYDEHRRLLDERADAHGAPDGVHSVGDHLRHDATYRERHGRRYLRKSLLLRQLLPAALAMGAILLALYLTVAGGAGQ